jgi:RHS repeat-associated protein
MEKDEEVKDAGNSYDFGARIYDSRLGRWLAVDPLYRKYINLSPYNFVDNSMINFKDPDGNKIEIAYTLKDKEGNDNTKYVQYDNGKYYQENKRGKLKELKGKKLDAANNNEFVKDVVSDIESLRNLDGDAKKRLEILEKSDFIHTIHKSNKSNQCIEKNKMDGDENKGTGTDVYYTQNEMSASGEKRPGFIALGHELLGHSFQSDQGITQFGLFLSSGTGEHSSKQCAMAYSEVAALNFENQIRVLYNITVSDESKLEMRTSHSKCSISPQMFEVVSKAEAQLINAKSQ